MLKNILLTIICLLATLSAMAQTVLLENQPLPKAVSYRGLHVLSDSLVWMSGPEGTILRTRDGGDTWKQLPPPPADSLDYRTLWAFDEQTAVIGSAGQPALIYRTQNGGEEWTETYRDSTGQAFFDAMAFVNDSVGFMMGDPVDQEFLLLATIYGGREWRALPDELIPDATEGEAGFAASNSGMVMTDSVVLFATGGSRIRVFRMNNRSFSFEAIEVPMEATSEARGIYSMASSNSGYVVAVGGDYTKGEEEENNLVASADGGLTWERIDGSGLRGYRSGVAWVPGTEATFVAVGTSGMDITRDGGRSWEPLSDLKLNAIRFAPSGRVGWAVGPEGNLVKLMVE